MLQNQLKPIKFSLLLIFAIIFSIINTSSYAANNTTEPEMAKSFMHMVRANFSIVDDPIIQNYIQALGQRLVKHSNNPNKKFRFFVVDDDTINAFSGPDGYIGINSGIAMATISESELASVLAHEITHATQKHILRARDEESSLVLPKIAATAAMIAAGMATKSNSSATTGGVLAGMAGGDQFEINTIRGFEREADRIGIKVLYLSGFDPAAMPEFFERVESRSLNSVGDTPASLLDHPVTGERIADARNRAMQYPKHKVIENHDYYLIKARLKALTSGTDYTTSNYFKECMLDKNEVNSDAGKYGYALFLMNSSKNQSAAELINTLLAKHPNNVIYKLTFAELKSKENHNQEALVILQKLLSENPDSYPVIIQYAQTLIEAKSYQHAENFLTAQTQNYPDDPEVYDLLTSAHAKNGHLAAAYQSRAKLFSILGYDKAAKLQLEQVKNN